MVAGLSVRKCLMETQSDDEFKDNLDKCSCGRKPRVKRAFGWVRIFCPNPNCGRKIKPHDKEWKAMVAWNKMVRE